MKKALTARQIQAPIEQVDLSQLPDWGDFSKVHEAFLRVRDEPFLECKSTAFPRRIPWLYGWNGCYLRAALVRRAFRMWGYPKIKKAFLFGAMEFESILPEEKKLSYNDHVAGVLRVGQDAYVIDPPVDFAGPIVFKKWMTTLAANGKCSSLKVSICNELTLGHNSKWDQTDQAQEVGIRGGKARSIDFFKEEYLRQEYELLVELNLDPEILLKNEPPWLT